jgi:flagellar hook-length control protein FliK
MLSSLNSSTASASLADTSASALEAAAILDNTAALDGTVQPAMQSTIRSTAVQTTTTELAFQDVLAKGTAEGEADPLFVDGINQPEVQVEATGEPEIDAEQWLLNALDQQLAQLQVRDAQTPVGATTLSNPRERELSLPLLAANSAGTAERIQRAINTADSTAAQAANGASVSGSALMSSEHSAAQTAQTTTQTESVKDESVKAGAVTTESVAEKYLATTSPALALWVNRSSSAAGENVQVNQTQNSAEILLAESGALTGMTADSLALSTERAASSLHSPLASGATMGIGDKAVQESGFQSVLKLPTAEAKWGEQLLHTLRDQVQVQLQQRIQNATIRLDPPELGSLEIFLSHESGRLNVHINASQADVARLLQQTSDRLRQELAGGQFTQVNVQTSNDGQSGQQQSRHGASGLGIEEIIQANIQTNGQPATDKARFQTGQSSDVLITV